MSVWVNPSRLRTWQPSDLSRIGCQCRRARFTPTDVKSVIVAQLVDGHLQRVRIGPTRVPRENGVMTDATPSSAESPLYLLFAHGINSRDEIVAWRGQHWPCSRFFGRSHAIGITPAHPAAGAQRGTTQADETNERQRVVLPEDTRETTSATALRPTRRSAHGTAITLRDISIANVVSPQNCGQSS